MTTYRAAWYRAALVVGSVGVVVALLGDDVGVNLTVAGSVGLTAGVFAFLVQEARDDPRHQRQSLAVGAGVTGAGFAVTGLAVLDGELTAILVVGLVAVSPPAVVGYRAILRRLTHRPAGSAWELAEPSPAAAPVPSTAAVGWTRDDRSASTLTDHELCSAWLASSDELDRARARADTTEQARLAAVRQRYLDEFERRDPVSFHRWLATSAHARCDPSAFFTGALDQARAGEEEPPRA